MKKKIFLFLLCLFGTVSFLSCGKDEVKPDGEVNENGVVGTWRLSDDDDVYVFKADGTGIGCEHADDVEQDMWNFLYTYSESDKTLTMTYDGKTDCFTNVEISGESASVTDDDERLLLQRVTAPVAVVALDVPNMVVNQYEGTANYACGNDGGRYEIKLNGYCLWHKSCSGTFNFEVATVSDVSGMIEECEMQRLSANSAVVNLNVGKNPLVDTRSSTIKISAYDEDGNMVKEHNVALFQSGAGCSFEVVAPYGEVDGNGAIVYFDVYNKDHNNITVHYPQGNAVSWEKQSTVKYYGGDDWKLKVAVPANVTGQGKNLEYTFTKEDGSSKVVQLYQAANSGGGGGTGDPYNPVTGKVRAVANVVGPGLVLVYDKEAQYYDGLTGTIDYVYYPSTGKYYIYAGYFCGDPDANGGKGIRFEAKKGYNSICVYHGVYFDYSTYGHTKKYNWDVYIKFTLP